MAVNLLESSREFSHDGRFGHKLVHLDVSSDAIEDRRHTGEFKGPLLPDDDEPA